MSSHDSEVKQFIRMTESPVAPLVVSLAVPTIFTMLISAVYNMADTYFVAKLGTSAAGAVGIVFSVMAIIQALGFMVGIGCGSQVSRALGRRNRDEANCFASSAMAMAIIFGLALSTMGLTFTDPLMELLGATPTIKPFAADYARYIFIGTAVMCASIVLNVTLRSEGRAVLSTIGLGFGGILNIVLDPIFIFKLNLGISGAAIATLISQCVSFAILLYFFLSGKSITKLSFRSISGNINVYLTIIKVGFSSFCRQGLAATSTVALNHGAAFYGDAAVAAMSIVNRIFMFVLSALIGFGQGFQPVAGYNYGAKKYHRVKEAFRFTAGVGTVFLTVAAVAGFYWAPEIVGIFRVDDPHVIEIGATAFRAQCLVLPLQPLIVISNMLFQSIGKAVQATFISATRQGIYFLPLVFILPYYFGLKGIQFTQTCSDTLAFLSCIPFLWFFFKNLGTAKMREEIIPQSVIAEKIEL